MKCISNDLSYTSNPPQNKCKKCGNFWFYSHEVPECKSTPIPTVTHTCCKKRLSEEASKVTCCECNPHDDCEFKPRYLEETIKERLEHVVHVWMKIGEELNPVLVDSISQLIKERERTLYRKIVDIEIPVDHAELEVLRYREKVVRIFNPLTTPQGEDNKN